MNILLTAVTLFVIHQGHIRFATHLHFGLQTAGFIVLLLLSSDTDAIPYMMLISIIAIAILDTPKASGIYIAAVIIAVYIYAWRATTVPFNPFFVGYLITSLAISLTVWFTANNLQQALQQSKQLTQNLQEQSIRLQAANKVMQRRARQLQTAAETSQRSASKLSLPDIFQETITLIQDQFDYYYVAIYMLDKQQNHLVLREANGRIGQQLKEEHFKLRLDTNSIVCWSAKHRQAHISHDVSQDPVYLMHPSLEKTRTEAAIPLIARDELLGVLDVQSTETHAFQEEDISILQILANQTAINIDNA
ncbi:MAG: GAF domain-containing protein, partial [Anaerolineales bacterium]|nr:GAF domain-containing protein [Anaerolineales bacterium]